MTNSRRIAALLGPSLVAVSLSESINPDIWATVNTPQIYLAGTLWFVAGLSIVRVHNRWFLGWPVLITVIGWILVLGGLIRMFTPVSAQRYLPNTTVQFATQMVLLAIGMLLTLKGYRAERERVQSGLE